MLNQKVVSQSDNLDFLNSALLARYLRFWLLLGSGALSTMFMTGCSVNIQELTGPNTYVDVVKSKKIVGSQIEIDNIDSYRILDKDTLEFTTVADKKSFWLGVKSATGEPLVLSYADEISFNLENIPEEELPNLRIVLRDVNNNTMVFSPTVQHPLVNGLNVIKISEFLDRIEVRNNAKVANINPNGLEARISLTTDSGSSIRIPVDRNYAPTTNTKFKFKIRINNNTPNYLNNILQKVRLIIYDNGNPARRINLGALFSFTGTVDSYAKEVEVVVSFSPSYAMALSLFGNLADIELIASGLSSDINFDISELQISEDGITFDQPEKLFTVDINSIKAFGISYFKENGLTTGFTGRLQNIFLGVNDLDFLGR